MCVPGSGYEAVFVLQWSNMKLIPRLCLGLGMFSTQKPEVICPVVRCL